MIQHTRHCFHLKSHFFGGVKEISKITVCTVYPSYIIIYLLICKHFDFSLCCCLNAFNRATVQKTQPRTAKSPEKSRTPTPSAHTAAAKQHTNLAFWPRRSCQLAFLREVQQAALSEHGHLIHMSQHFWFWCAFCRQTGFGRVWGWRVEASRLQQSSQTEDSVPERER